MESRAHAQAGTVVHQVVGDSRNESHQATNTAAEAGVERWTKTPLRRGRQARDPLAVSVTFDCSSMDDLETMLKNYLANPTAPPEHATLEFRFPTSAAFMVSTHDYKGSGVMGNRKEYLYGALNKTAVSVIDALAPIGEPKDQMRRQKAIARAMVESVEKVDGFRYSFNNNWLSKEDEANRFSFFCNDSTLNKGRAANEGVHNVGKSKRKPAYDCRGLLSIKFSITKQSLELHYRHIPLHDTFEARAPPPRKDSKRRKLMEIFNPESLPKTRERRRTSAPTTTQSALGRRPATEPPRASTTANVQATTRADGLALRTNFLGPPAAAVNPPAPGNQSTVLNEQQNQTPEPLLFPAEKLSQLHDTERRATTKPAPKPKAPGAGTRRAKGKSQPPPAPQALPGISTAAAAPVPPSTAGAESVPPPAMSELEFLKAKLLEAEQRIQRLEAEKGMPPGPPGWPSEPPVGYSATPAYPNYHPPPQYHYPPSNFPPASQRQDPTPAANPVRPFRILFQHPGN